MASPASPVGRARDAGRAVSGWTGGEDVDARADARAMTLAGELGAQLGRLKGAGPKIRQLLSMVQLDRPAEGDERPAALGALPDGARGVAFTAVRRVIEQDLEARVTALFDDIDETPFALSSLGQVHRAVTAGGADVAVKVQHAGAAEAVERDLRNLGIVAPILKALAPGVDAGAVLAEIRERIAEEVDYEVEAQHQRRLERMLRGHPHVRVPRVHTELSARRVLVSDHVDGVRLTDVADLGEDARDRAGEAVVRCYFSLAWRAGVVAGDPQPENCILCPDGRVCLLDFGLVRDIDAGHLAGELRVWNALAEGDAQRVHDGLADLGYLGDPAALELDAVFELVSIAGEWLIVPGIRRIDPAYVGRMLELAYPPRSPFLGLMRRMSIPAKTLLLRRMEVQLLSLLGELNAAGDWAAIGAEHHSGAPPSTELGREELAIAWRA